MKVCNNCGARIPDDSVFCDECGTKINIINETYDKPKADKESGKENKLLYAFGLIAVACISFGVAYLFGNSDAGNGKKNLVAEESSLSNKETVIDTVKETETEEKTEIKTEEKTEETTVKETEIQTTEKSTETVNKKKMMKKTSVMPCMTDAGIKVVMYYDANMVEDMSDENNPSVKEFSNGDGVAVEMTAYATDESYVLLQRGIDLDSNSELDNYSFDNKYSGYNTYVIHVSESFNGDEWIIWEDTVVYVSDAGCTFEFVYCYTDENNKKQIEEVISMLVKGIRKGSKSGGTVNYSDYILPDSSSRYLEESDLEGLSKDMLSKARNEIYARHGRLFSNPDLQSYFNSKSWYSGTINPNDFDQSCLNEYEKYNANFILQYENS